MSLRALNPRHLVLIGLYSTRYAVRGGPGLLFLLLVLTTGLVVAHAVVSPVESLHTAVEKQGHEIEMDKIVSDLAKSARPVVAWAIRDSTKGLDEEEIEKAEKRSDAWARYLLEDRPAMLSAILLILIFSMPFLVVTGAFNMFSGDVQSRGLRYHLFRTERGNIFFGRFLGTAVYSLMVNAILIATISLYIGLKLQIYGFGVLLGWSVFGFLALTLLTLPYLAFCAWISSAIDSPFGSLAVSSLVIGFVPLLALIGRSFWRPVGWINYLLPWGIQNRLLHDSLFGVVGAVGLCLVYTLVFLFLGFHHFSRRDL